jgi:methionyl aminopeptidase
MYTRIKTDTEIENMRTGGRMLAQVLELLKVQVEPGVTTRQLSDVAASELKKLGGEPAFLNYPGVTPFPAVICMSVNDAVVHGIPDDTPLKEGDVLSMDFGVRYRGMIVDSAIAVVCGRADPKIAELLQYTESSLEAGLGVVRNGCRTGDIGAAVEKVLNKKRLGIVRDLVGHGVGHEVHEDPNIPNYGRAGTGAQLVAGMTIAIEPMATLGKDGVFVDSDGWTVRTKDGSIAAHFEHTVLVTENGYEILTTTK